MKNLIKKHSKIISILIPLLVVASLWQLPFPTLVLGVTFIMFSLTIAITSIFNKQREAYLQGKTTRSMFVHNIFLEIFGILLAMMLAGLLGRYIAQTATEHIVNDLTKLVAGILISLLAGIVIGVVVKRAWGRMTKSTLES